MFKKIVTYLMSLIIICGLVPLHIIAEAPEDDIKSDIYATSALLLDAENGRVLYEKNGYNIMPMASTTKIMTCIITLENADLNDIVTVSSYAASMPDVQLGIRKDEQYVLRDLVYALMLESSNDAAVAIAEHVSGSVEAFCELMTNKAKELGAINTTFKTPNGLDADGHQTTSYDLALITKYAITNEEFIKITNESTRSFTDVGSKRNYFVSNKNRFLQTMEGAIGVKTGFTGKAGYCFVGAVKREDKTLISVVLASGWPPNKNYKWHDTDLLMNYGLKNYKKVQITEQNKKFDNINVDNGKINNVEIYMEGDISLLLNENEKVDITYEIPEILVAPIEKEQIIGYSKYYIDGKLYAQLPIKSKHKIEEIDYKFCLDIILQKWFVK